jgi:hypothetical protein
MAEDRTFGVDGREGRRKKEEEVSRHGPRKKSYWNYWMDYFRER